MRLEHLFDGELIYADRGHWVEPFRENEWLGWAEGTGTLTGTKLAGRLRWLNHPRERPDATWLPDYHVVVQTEDAATVFIRLIGLNLYETDGENYGEL